jgi:hypothetical protein
MQGSAYKFEFFGRQFPAKETGVDRKNGWVILLQKILRGK